MDKQFLSLEEFIELLGSKGYDWNEVATVNLLVDLFYNEVITPVFLYDGNLKVSYKERNLLMFPSDKDTWEEIEIQRAKVRGYFSLLAEDMTDFYKKSINNLNNTLDLTDLPLTLYELYGKSLPAPSMLANLGGKELTRFLYATQTDNTLSFNSLSYPVAELQEYFGEFDIAGLDCINNTQSDKALIEQLQAENERLKHQLEQAQSNQTNDDKELPHKSQMAVARLVYTLLANHDYDLSTTKGKANDLIVNASNLKGTPVTRNFVASWIDLANQVKSDSIS